MATAPLEFFCADFCPFAHRLWIALEEKEVPYQYREVNYCASFLPSTQDFYSVSTTRTVPAVRLPDGTCLEVLASVSVSVWVSVFVLVRVDVCACVSVSVSVSVSASGSVY